MGQFQTDFQPPVLGFPSCLVDQYGGVAKIYGAFGAKQLYVSDSKALHHILVKDQYVFEQPNYVIQTNRVLFGMGLFGTLGEYHKKQRKMLNPVFSAKHLRDMLPIFYEITYKVRDAIALRVKDRPQKVDVLHWTTRTALEFIGQSGLGYSFDEFDDGPANEYSLALKNLVPTIFLLAAYLRLMPILVKLGTPRFRRFLMGLVPHKAVRRTQEIVDVMDRTSIQIFEHKRLALQQGDEAVLKQVGRGKDIMSILLKANIEATEEDRLQDLELVSQMTTMIFAATDTTSGALARTLSILAEHPDVQDKLRQELIEAREGNGDLDYNHLSSLPYLDSICRETLRLYPPVPYVTREARQDVIVPLSTPITGKSGFGIGRLHIPNGTRIMIGILGANRNPEIWGDDAYEWKPERWLSPLPDSVTQAHIPGIYSNTMTFLGGGRVCIGFKFSQLEMKAVLSVLVESFKFSSTDEKIVWKFGALSSPTVKDCSEPQLPLIVSMA
ncbi:hypothetical protein PILCRDRAFT_815850 [Piloderma croceum F 1598]|uniref:Cytochrome P450 n=1 Tax=Piloderma croceum (strain F 1598) TaxID=765440 RepID=A0A0C3G7K2_PILCF|nr:hypothetical protein PILCRDRAFT_815850 [Piloderma croceum F 1598]